MYVHKQDRRGFHMFIFQCDTCYHLPAEPYWILHQANETNFQLKKLRTYIGPLDSKKGLSNIRAFQLPKRAGDLKVSILGEKGYNSMINQEIVEFTCNIPQDLTSTLCF